MLPLFLVLSIISFLDATCYASPLTFPRWRPDLRRRDIGLHARNTLEGVATNTPMDNSTIIPVAFSSDKMSYYALSSVGNVNLRLALDTASADLWIVSSNCTTKQCDDLPRYPLAYQSPTFVPVNSNATAFGVSYADSTGAQGFIARESISVGNLTVPGQAFGLATTSNVTFKDEISGVFGLGFPRLSDISSTIPNATPIFATLAQSGSLDYPVFGLSLTRDSSGTLAFGAIDGSVVANRSLVEFNEVVPFAPFGSESNSSSYLQWAIVLEGISVNGTTLSPQPTYPVQTMNKSIALIDVGTAGIFGPYQDVARIFSMIDSARLVDDTTGQYVLPCDTQETLALNFGGRDFILQPTDYIIGPAAENPNLCLSWPRALPPSSDGIDWQIGSAFLRTVYSVYSFGINTKEPPMIGFYPLSNATTVTQTPQQVSAFLASVSATVPTTLPNYLISVPSLSTPSYTFNASISAPVGKVVATGLATSTYVPLLASHHPNATAIPTVTPSPTVATLILTDTSGHTLTTTSTAAERSVTLGSPAAGWTNSARSLGRSLSVGDVVGALVACACAVLLV